GSQGENAGGNGNQGQNPPVGQNSQDGAVQTGDTSDMNLPVLLVSVCGLGILAIRRKKNA
ncbi:MAG: LPXTG cell wall anchor domain-containing protein, partial [Butyricicoccus pullicaecorum]|nr:LPXTG cell wall anchor domain-containing protein [Butyricicoccus pullicaecorum]